MVSSVDWYSPNDELHIILPERISYNVGDISIYIENHKAKRLPYNNYELHLLKE